MTEEFEIRPNLRLSPSGRNAGSDCCAADANVRRALYCKNSYREKCGKYNFLPERRTTAQHDSALTGCVSLEIFYASGATQPRPEVDFRASDLIPTEPPT